MTYSIIIYNHKVFAKDISVIPKKELDTIFHKIEQLRTAGSSGAQIKRLKNYPVADRRLRVGNYRILFNIDLERKTVTLFRILHRSKLY